MITIKKFEQISRKFNRSGEKRNFTQMAFDPSYYGVDFIFDTELELDILTKNEKTAKALVNYLESLKVPFLRPDYYVNCSSDIERLGLLKYPELNGFYEDVVKENGTCNEKYMLDKDINMYRIQIGIGGKNIRTMYDFITGTREDLLTMSKEYDDSIEICPYQLDNIVDGSIIYSSGEVKRNNLKFTFLSGSPWAVFITACMLNQSVKNQQEFDELGFIDNDKFEIQRILKGPMYEQMIAGILSKRVNNS